MYHKEHITVRQSSTEYFPMTYRKDIGKNAPKEEDIKKNKKNKIIRRLFLPSRVICMPTMLSLLFFISCFLSTHTSAFGVDIHKEITQKLKGETYLVDGSQMSFTQDALDEVKEANEMEDYIGILQDYYHFDNEKLKEGSQKIIDGLARAEAALKKYPPDGYTARKQFGAALHTLQDLYAHSNWANIKTGDGDIHPDLGMKTLSNPSKLKYFCDASGGTLLPWVTDITSGYFDLCKATPKYKCHHGLKGITSPPFCPARPGINKDDESRSLFGRASKQAEKASKVLLAQFLNRKGIASDKLRMVTFLGKISVAVVINTMSTKSNGMDIIRERVESFIQQYSDVAYFILVEFNAQTSSPAYVFTRAELKLKLNLMRVTNGGDCKGMLYKAALIAAKASTSRGKMWWFSHKLSSDYSDVNEVRNVVKLKKIMITQNVVGICTPPILHTYAQDAMVTETPRYSVDEHAITLASETGGQIFLGDTICSNSTETSHSIFEEGYLCDTRTERNLLMIRDDLIPIQRATVHLDEHAETVYVPVDDTIKSISFSLFTYNGKINDVQISRPDGTTVLHSDPNVTFIKLGSQSIVAVDDPIVGNWNVTMSGSGQATFIAQGDSAIDLNYIQFVSSVLGRFETMFAGIAEGNPYANGKSSTALARLDGPVTNYSFEIVEATGTTIRNAAEKLYRNTISSMNEDVLSIKPLDQPFSVMVTGFTLAGNSFQRLSRSTFFPKEIKVSFNESSRPDFVREGGNTTVSFTIENFRTESIIVEIKVAASDMLLLRGFETSNITIPGSSSGTIYVTIIAPVGCTESFLSLTAFATNWNNNLGNSDTVDIMGICGLSGSSSASVIAAKSSKRSKSSKKKEREKEILRHRVPTW